MRLAIDWWPLQMRLARLWTRMLVTLSPWERRRIYREGRLVAPSHTGSCRACHDDPCSCPYYTSDGLQVIFFDQRMVDEGRGVSGFPRDLELPPIPHLPAVAILRHGTMVRVRPVA